MMLHRHFEDSKDLNENMTRTKDLNGVAAEKPETEESAVTTEQKRKRRKKNDD